MATGAARERRSTSFLRRMSGRSSSTSIIPAGSRSSRKAELMAASYLIRLDDACPEMDSERWQRVEEVLDEFKIKPIIAVVPDNQDNDLKRQSIDPVFWDKVRRWQSKGWAIAMHGHTHVMHATNERLL